MAKSKLKTKKERSEASVQKRAKWASQDRFAISGAELEQIANISSIFGPLAQTCERILETAEMEGKLGFDYFYPDGAEVPIHIVNKKEEERLAEIDKKRKMLEDYIEKAKSTASKLGAQIEEIENKEQSTEKTKETPTEKVEGSK
jgi:vacuolar-type H+-ATPase subunit I/STV1